MAEASLEPGKNGTLVYHAGIAADQMKWPVLDSLAYFENFRLARQLMDMRA